MWNSKRRFYTRGLKASDISRERRTTKDGLKWNYKQRSLWTASSLYRCRRNLIGPSNLACVFHLLGWTLMPAFAWVSSEILWVARCQWKGYRNTLWSLHNRNPPHCFLPKPVQMFSIWFCSLSHIMEQKNVQAASAIASFLLQNGSIIFIKSPALSK